MGVLVTLVLVESTHWQTQSCLQELSPMMAITALIKTNFFMIVYFVRYHEVAKKPEYSGLIFYLISK